MLLQYFCTTKYYSSDSLYYKVLCHTKYCACQERWQSKITTCCTCHEKSHCNITKCCACHEKWDTAPATKKWLSWLILLTYETSLTMRGAGGIALRHHQLLRLPRKIALQNLREFAKNSWGVMCSARPLRPWSEHDPTMNSSSRTRPFAEVIFRASETHYNTSRSGYLSRFHQILRLPRKCHEKSHRNITKGCAGHEESDSNAAKYCTCHEKWLSWLILLRQMRCECCVRTDVSDVTDVTWLNWFWTELLLDWAVAWLNYYFTELLLYWAVIWLSCYFIELLLYWAVIWLSCYFIELLLYWPVTLLNSSHF